MKKEKQKNKAGRAKTRIDAKELKTKKIIFGTKEAIKALKRNPNKIEKIYIASDCSEDIIKRLEQTQTKASLVKLTQTIEELKEICKKPFNISVISVLKDKEKEEKKGEGKEKKEEKEKEKIKKKETKKSKEKKTKSNKKDKEEKE